MSKRYSGKSFKDSSIMKKSKINLKRKTKIKKREKEKIMCGRYKISKPVSKTVDLVKTNIKVEDTDNYNAHPSQKLPIIKSYTNGKALELCEWGLVPGWSKKLEKFSPLINARKET